MAFDASPQQIAAATAEQARGSELIMKSADNMRLITQQMERSSQEQAEGGLGRGEGAHDLVHVAPDPAEEPGAHVSVDVPAAVLVDQDVIGVKTFAGDGTGDS